MAEVHLVQMPFAGLERPSLALGMFTRSLREAGIETEGTYAGFEFAERIGLPSYHLVGLSSPSTLVGEWFFTASAFRERTAGLKPIYPGEHYFGTDGAFVRQVYSAAGCADSDAFLARVQGHATEFVETIAQRLVDRNARLVACTSMFDQHVASIALLRRVKELSPDTVTVLGGANCAGAMGVATHRCFPWVDFTATGEFDLDVAEIFGSLAREGRRSRFFHLQVPGLLGPMQRDIRELAEHPAAKILRDMDRAAVPDYSDYFRQLDESPLRPHIRASITVETSRGCWWGAKQHCTFCGLNADGMAFRRKSPERALAEFRGLSREYRTKNFSVADNIIDMGYFKSVLPELADDPGDLKFFYETKANIRREHVKQMADAGCEFIQPGIESLHDETLKLMRKGTTACQNIQLLKYCLEYGVVPAWGILCGFPGSDPEWVAEVGRKLGSLSHLPPPNGTTTIRFDRFSPYHSEATERGLDLTPLPSYDQVYPLPAEDLEQLAYFFQLREGTPTSVQATADLSRRAAARWRELFWGGERPVLEILDASNDCVLIEDSRPDYAVGRHALVDLEARVLLAAEDACSTQSLHRDLRGQGVECTESELRLTLESLEQRGLVWRSSRQWISLPTRKPDRPMNPTADDAVGRVDLASYFQARRSIVHSLSIKSRQARRSKQRQANAPAP